MATLYLIEGKRSEGQLSACQAPSNQSCREKKVDLALLMDRLYPFKPVYFRATLSVPGEQYPPRPLNAAYLLIEESEVDNFLFEQSGVYILQDQSPKLINIDHF